MFVTLAAAAKPRQAALLLRKKARILGGGTLVVADLNYGRHGAETVVTLDRLGLDTIKVTRSRVTLGAMVTMAKIGSEPRLAFLHPVANSIGGPAVRGMATVGGNLFAPSPYGDMAAALLALDAKVTLVGTGTAKTLAIEDFLRQREKLGNAVVTSISFDQPAQGSFRFIKVIRRRPVSAAVATIAAVLPLRRGRIVGARIALGAMATTAIRARAAERVLEGKVLDAAAIEEAARAAIEGTAPATDSYASAWYRREVLPVHLKRLLSA